MESTAVSFESHMFMADESNPQARSRLSPQKELPQLICGPRRLSRFSLLMVTTSCPHARAGCCDRHLYRQHRIQACFVECPTPLINIKYPPHIFALYYSGEDVILGGGGLGFEVLCRRVDMWALLCVRASRCP